MKRIAIGAACLLFLAAGPARAEPMWDVASYWVCKVKLHIKVNVDGTDVAINEEQATITYDFAKSTITSSFSNQVGSIGRKFYVEGSADEYHYIEDKWTSYGTYPGIITGTRGEYWKTGASGYASDDRRMWISNFRCNPG